MIKQKGFSLIELMISMFIVSIAMLGFAVLQTFSARALSSSYARTTQTAVLQEFVKIFQVGNIPLGDLSWGGNQDITFDCENAVQQLRDARTGGSVLGNGVKAVCGRMDDAPGVLGHDVVFGLHRNELIPNKLSSYTLSISFAYLPKRPGRVADEAAGDDVDVTADGYCPLTGYDTEEFNKKRVQDNVVCSHVEVML